MPLRASAIPNQQASHHDGGLPLHGLSADERQRLFCGHCKSWMFTRPHAFDQFVNVRPTMLKDASWFVPFIETYTSEKLPWASTPAVHSFGQFPPMETFGELMAEFTRHMA